MVRKNTLSRRSRKTIRRRTGRKMKFRRQRGLRGALFGSFIGAGIAKATGRSAGAGALIGAGAGLLLTRRR
jgi:hypothetical protein